MVIPPNRAHRVYSGGKERVEYALKNVWSHAALTIDDLDVDRVSIYSASADADSPADAAVKSTHQAIVNRPLNTFLMLSG